MHWEQMSDVEQASLRAPRVQPGGAPVVQGSSAPRQSTARGSELLSRPGAGLSAQCAKRQRLALVGPARFSRLNDGLVGAGARPGLTRGRFLVVILGCADASSAATQRWLIVGLPPAQGQPLSWDEALVLSIRSFHAPRCFQPIKSLGDPVAVLVAVEAISGLIIAISFLATFLATFIQRLLGSNEAQ